MVKRIQYNICIKTVVYQNFKTVPPIPGPIPDPLFNWVTELSNVSSEQRWILLTNLKAAAVYQFRVSAVNSVGEGSPSDPSNKVMLPQEGTCLFYSIRCTFTLFNSNFIYI